MNFGIIGFGKMGKIRFDVIKTIGKHKVISICDIRPVQISEGIAFTKNYQDIIDDKNIDGIFVCTPNYLNKKIVVAGLKKGKHVFSEKPPGVNLNEVKEIIKVEKANPKLKLMFGFNHRHHDSVMLAKELIDSGKYGKVLWMRGRYGKSVDKNFSKTWRANKKTAGGGIFLDQGIHMLDLFLMMCDDFEEVKAFISRLYWKLDIEDNVFLILRNKKGQMASLHSTMTQWRHLFSFEIFMERGYITINGLKTSSGTYGREEMTVAMNRTTAPRAAWTTEKELRFETDESWRREVEMFINAIETNSPVKVGNTKDALKLMRIVDKVYKEK